MHEVHQYLLMDAYGANPDVKAPINKEVERSNRILEKTTKYLPEAGRYEAGVLWRKDDQNLLNNLSGTRDHFNRTLKRLESNPELAVVVSKGMERNIQLGFEDDQATGGRDSGWTEMVPAMASCRSSLQIWKMARRLRCRFDVS